MEQPVCAARREEAGLLHQGTAARGAVAVKAKISGSSTKGEGCARSCGLSTLPEQQQRLLFFWASKSEAG